MRRLDLRTRLLAAVGVIALLQIVIAFVVVSVTRSQLVDQIDDRLAVASNSFRLAGTLQDVQDGSGPDEPANGRDRGPRERLGDTYGGFLTREGTLRTVFVANSTGSALAPPDIEIDDARRALRRPITLDSQRDDLHYRVTTAQAPGGGFLITAIPLNSVERTIRQLVAVVAITAAAIMVVLLLVTWWVVRLGISPIKRMTANAETIADGDLSQRIANADTETEAGRLGLALNTMLTQIETSFGERTRAEAKLRQFIADASHELRTPVATIRGYAELYRLGGLGNEAELDDAMRRTEQESERMSRLIADMLNLAKLDRDPTVVSNRIDMSELARDAALDASARHPDRQIVSDTIDHELIVSGDEDLLRQMITNLVANAVVHNDAPATVTVSAQAEGGHVVLTVADTGSGMEADVVERATERFFRADPSRSRNKGGSGLGLAIVDSVVHAHAGTLELTSTPGLGTTVRVTLPPA